MYVIGFVCLTLWEKRGDRVKSKQNKTKQNKTKQNKTKQNVYLDCMVG